MQIPGFFCLSDLTWNLLWPFQSFKKQPFLKFWIFRSQKMNNYIKIKIQSLNKSQNGTFLELLDSLKLISRKIWVVGIFRNFHCENKKKIMWNQFTLWMKKLISRNFCETNLTSSLMIQSSASHGQGAALHNPKWHEVKGMAVRLPSFCFLSLITELPDVFA